MLTLNAHKSREGYYLNHDVLMASSEVNKAKYITYFIAINSPQKLDPEDRFTILNKLNSSRKWNFFGSVLGTACLITLSRGKTGILISPFFWNGLNLCLNDTTEKNILRSDLLTEMTLKYKFTTFDFHNSKREAQISSLVSQIKALPAIFQNI